MRNVHRRELTVTREQLRPWIEASWTATARDPFPRDVIRNWRRNPPGTDPLASVPEVTRVGHGPFSFRFESWDGERWRVRVETAGYEGWHGFDLEPTPRGCRLTHTLDLDLSGAARAVWPLCFAGVHDWAVEATFDRIEEALRTGAMPTVTTRPMPWPTAAWFRIIRSVRRALPARRAWLRAVFVDTVADGGSARVIKSLDQLEVVTLFVEDLAATRAFYQSVFGLEPVYEDAVSAVVKLGALLINLLQITEAPELMAPAKVAGRDAGARSLLTIAVADIDSVVAELAAHGVPLINGPVDRPWGRRTASFADPAGNVWEIAQNLR